MSPARREQTGDVTGMRPKEGLSANSLIRGAVVLAIFWGVTTFWGQPELAGHFVEGLAVIVAGLAAGLSYIANKEIGQEQATLQQLRDENQQRFEILRDHTSARRDARAFIGQHIGTVNGQLAEIAGRMAAVGLEFDDAGSLRGISGEDESGEELGEPGHSVRMPLIRVPATLVAIVRTPDE